MVSGPSNRLVPLECAMVSRPEGTPSATKPITEEMIKVTINPEYPEQTVMIGSTLIEEGRSKLCGLLQRNLDIFAWKSADMIGVPRHIAKHRLNEEVGKLVEVGIMKEVHYHDWLSNPVMVKKHDDSWRMCVDFKDLNKACLKMVYTLRKRLESKILVRFPIQCFLDGIQKGLSPYSNGKEDGRKTALLQDQGEEYSIIQRCLLVSGMLGQPINDWWIKRSTKRLAEIWKYTWTTLSSKAATLKEINMKLNPKKCTFGVEEGMFLGYKVNTRGLNVFPDKVDVVLSLPSLKCLKDVQKLNGKLASLNRFLAKSAEKSLPFFKTLKKCTKKSDFHWTTEAEKAFKQMKQLIAELPMLTAPMEKEELIVYLAATKETVSAVLITEKEAKHMPVYFVSRALRGPELNYTSVEKLILSRPEVAGRLQKWSIELGEYAIHYRPRVSVKGHILADFIVERPEEDSPDTLMEVEEELPEPWILFTDGSSCTDGSGAGLMLTNPEGVEFTYALRFRTYVAKEADMIHYLEKVRALTENFKAFSIKQIPRSENKKADALNKIASTSFAHLSKQVLAEELKEKFISEVEILAVVKEEGDTWMTPLFKYHAEGTLPADVKKSIKGN
ncbi:reverse transcriptase domain-containing protein [Tanacetum coccineum]